MGETPTLSPGPVTRVAQVDGTGPRRRPSETASDLAVVVVLAWAVGVSNQPHEGIPGTGLSGESWTRPPSGPVSSPVTSGWGLHPRHWVLGETEGDTAWEALSTVPSAQ